ncbi:MAG: hypothetical protein HY647_07900, partial [Acidobacteria bacterium]|nr:hypothetical protein [Acidobacteriota bacterium]
MRELKKLFFAVAVTVSLGLVGASSAFAQANCTANSVPTLVRTAGLTELTGSIVLSTCTGVIPASGVNITVTIQPSAAVITNAGGFTGGTVGYAPTLVAFSSVTGLYAGVVGAVSGNTVTFGLPATPGGETLTSITIGVVPGILATVGIRVNVNASGVAFPGQIAALLTSSPAGVLAITNNFLNVAIPQTGLTGTFTAGGGIAQCAPRVLTTTPPGVANYTVATPFGYGTGGAAGAPLAPFASSVPVVTVIEGFSSSFLVAGAPPAGNGEGADTTGATVAGGIITVAGTRGTRVLFRITGIQTNIALYAPQTVTGTGTSVGLTMVLVPTADGNGDGSVPLVAPIAGTASRITGTTITYEVTASSNAVAERVAVPFGLFTFGTPSTGTATVSIALAAISTQATPVAIGSASIPRFADVPLPGGFISVIACVTNILFPWVANTAGYDTGFAIANTTSDSPVFGTASQTGACVYNFYGTNPPSGGTFTTPAFAGGVTD